LDAAALGASPAHTGPGPAQADGAEGGPAAGPEDGPAPYAAGPDGGPAPGPQDGPDDGPAPHAAADALSERDRDLLFFERHWWRHAGAKEQAIRERFAMSATRYYQLLNVLLDRPEALVADPMLVKRLRRLRSARQKARAARRVGGRN